MRQEGDMKSAAVMIAAIVPWRWRRGASGLQPIGGLELARQIAWTAAKRGTWRWAAVADPAAVQMAVQG